MIRTPTRIAAALALVAASLAIVAAAGTLVARAGDRNDVAAIARSFGGTPVSDPIARGRYIVRTAGCNDCHTPHYMEKAGELPERDWLTGAGIGFQGPWGTTYAANLRLIAHDMTEAQWLTRTRQSMRPPMPWFNLRAMTDDDLRAIYAFVRSLGPAGTPAPAYVAPDGKVDTPYFVFVPQNLPQP